MTSRKHTLYEGLTYNGLAGHVRRGLECFHWRCYVPAVWACWCCKPWAANDSELNKLMLSLNCNEFLCSFQVKSGKELKAFLFNDFLMLTRPRSSITGNISKKIGFNEQEVTYDIYRKVRRVRISLALGCLLFCPPKFGCSGSAVTEIENRN